MSEGYVQLRRGLEEHLPYLSGNEVKVYNLCLMRAAHSGKHAGCFYLTLRETAPAVGMSTGILHQALRALSDAHGPRKVRFIEYTAGTNMHHPSMVRVLKYKAHVPDSTVSDNDTVAERKDDEPQATALSSLPECMTTTTVNFTGYGKGTAANTVWKAVCETFPDVFPTNGNGGAFGALMKATCLRDCSCSQAQVEDCTALVLEKVQRMTRNGVATRSFRSSLVLLRKMFREDRVRVVQSVGTERPRTERTAGVVAEPK